MNKMLLRLLLFTWLIPWLASQEQEDDRMFDKTEPRSRLMMVDGNMFFHAGYNRNITFVAQGQGSIFIGNIDISDLPTLAQVDEVFEKLDSLSETITMLKARGDAMSRSMILFANISKSMISVTRNISLDVRMLRDWKKEKNIKDLRLRKYLAKISKGIKILVEAFKVNGCEVKPCQGGGTCIPRFGKSFFCLCPPHRTGINCESDVDECATYEGMMACQNNATCENIPNGFLCHCPSGFHGPLCQYKHSSCHRTPGLCGHGHCIEAVEGDLADWRCICEVGYKLSGDKENPTCIDVDECENNPCHPGVDCINLPGTFQCSGCPKGFFGNGIQCADVDECAQEEYPCSTIPRAPCINTVGSYHCGACPPGYRGDGKSCKRYSACAHRPCFPSANCTDDFDNINAGGFTCQCPEGFLGDGIGPTGCKKGNSSICRAEGRCLNGGSCKAVTEDSYLCICPEGYFGSRCEKVSECIYSPCKNGGTCQYDIGNGYTCLCPPKFYGTDCETEEDFCGQHFTSREGNFSYPENAIDNTEVMMKVCDFVISPPANNEALRIWFTRFNYMENRGSGPIDCRKAFGNVSLYDGDNDGSNLFAVFCGSASSPKAPWINTPITMTGSRAMLRYKGTKGGWAIKWELKKRECGYRTSLPSGSLSVPAHYMNISCEWFISAPSSKVIELTIPIVKLGSDERNCSISQLEVFDGYAAYDSHRVIHFCENVNNTVRIRTTGPFMSIYFVNDVLWGSTSTLPGFHLTYSFVDPDHKCGGDIINTNKDFSFSGEITSPNWGGLYPPDMHCTWTIDAVNENATSLSAQALKLEIDSFDIPSPYMFDLDRSNVPQVSSINRPIARGRRPLYRSLIKCTQDYLRLYASGTLIYDACSSHRPPPNFLVPEGKAIVQFRSDSKQQGKGFKLKYHLTCEKTFIGNGTIQTWNYPDGGSKGVCRYVLSGQPSEAIILKVKHIGLRVADVRECFFTKEISEQVEDYVKFTGGRMEDKFLNTKYVCPRFPFVEEGEFIVSASRPLIIEYSSSGNEKNKGLLLEYATIDVGCGGIFPHSTGKISSPSYPNKYLPHMHCVYLITVAWTKNVRLTFDNFDLEVVQNDDCTYDRVEIYEYYISEDKHGKLLGKFCGSMLPPTILSPTFEMAVVFISDRSVAGNGFSARFDAIDANSHCDQTFTAHAGNIIFNSTKGRYSECTYNIALPFNSKILIKVESMNLPCSKGRIEIRNGAEINSPGFPSLWGQSEICNDHSLQTTLRTHSNRAYLKLILVENKGVSFNISYESITSNCGGRVSGVSGSIAAPQYPQKDSRPIECEWIVAVSPGNRVNFQLALVDDLSSSDENGFCGIFAANRLDVLDGPQIGSRILRRYCKKVVAADTVTATDHEIMVRYKQQGGMQFGALFGFLAHFSTDCRDMELTDFSGTIQSPGFPDPVYTNLFCNWVIKVPLGNRIKLTFHNFVMDQPPIYNYRNNQGCYQNWLKFDPTEVGKATIRFSGGVTNVTNNIEEACQRNVPSSIISAGNILHLTLQTKQKPDNKFWLSWSTLGCGGDIKTASNITVGINDFGGNITSAECLWKIQAPIGKKIQFVVKKFLIFRNGQSGHTSRDCLWEEHGFTGLETFAGLSNDSDIVQDKVCSPVKETPQMILSHSNQMFVRMKYVTSNIQHERNGAFFNAEVLFIDTNPGDHDDCGGIIELPVNEPKLIHSPRFPSEYPKDCRCAWLFKAPPGHHINFIVKEYTTPNSHPQYELTKKITMKNINNLTCQHPLQLIEGSLTIYNGGNATDILDRFCADIKEPENIEVDAGESVVTFQGASAHRIHMNGEEEKKRIGFVLEANATCGSLEFATLEEHSMTLYDIPKGSCNVTIKKKNPDDAGVVVRLDEYFLKNQISRHHTTMTTRDYLSDELYIQVDGGEPVRRAIDLHALRSLRNPYTHEEFRGENEIKISLFKRTTLLAVNVALVYHSDYQDCGTALQGKSGFVSAPRLVEDMECIWTMDNNPGNKVAFTTVSVVLPYSENCVESYIELRKGSDEGELIERFCGEDIKNFSAEAMWIKMRFIKPEQSDPEAEGLIDENLNAPKEYGFKFRFQQLGGGVINIPGFIMEPKFHYGTTLEYKINGEEGKGIVIKMESANFPEYRGGNIHHVPSGLYFLDHAIPFYAVVNKMKDLINSGSRNVITGFHPPNELHFPTSQIVMYAVGMVENHYSFTLEWDSIELDDIPNENKTIIEQKVYVCGGLLTPTWEWQSIRSPPASIVAQPNAIDAGYPPDIHCMWHMTRPKLSGIEVKVVTMDLENVHKCVFDYVAILASDEEYEDIEEALENAEKMCQKDQENKNFTFSFNKKLNIHFVSDRNRGGSGFEIQYKLSCTSFDYIKKEQGVYSGLITNPGYPNAALADSCGWTVILESNRRIQVMIEDIFTGAEECKDGFLTVSSQGSLSAYYSQNKPKFCGRESEERNLTMRHGRLHIRWFDQNQKYAKGFKVTIQEVLEECTVDELFVDESTPVRTFTTPQYPQMIPNSVDCDYVLRAPAGHRLQFTVDPKEFRLESSAENDTCTCESCDYLEVRDGPTEASALIGRYCHILPPSTITSTGNFLFVKLRTDSYAQSSGFKAEIRMAVCGGTILLQQNRTFLLQSPNYPDIYPNPEECKWTIHSPNSHFIEATLNHIWVAWSVNCTWDRLMIYDGNFSAPYLLDPICSPQRITSLDTRSESSLMSVQFVANSTIPKTSRAFCKDKKCGFELALKVSDQGCGGVIEDTEGQILPPGYPDRLLPHVNCRWDFKAGPGYRYLIEFEFTDKSRNGFYQQRYEFHKSLGKTRLCFMDVVFFNGKWATDRPIALGQHYFCEDETTFITESDYASLIYTDSATKDHIKYNSNADEDKFYVPFRINYTRVPAFFDELGCTFKIENNLTLELGIFKNLSSMTTDLHYCHLAIVRPENYGTTIIKILNYTDEQSTFPRDCSDWGSYVEFESDDEIRTVSERFCNTTFAGKKTNDILRVYNNKQIDIHVKTQINAWAIKENQKFILVIEFQPCGGVLDDPNFGEITSPGYGVSTYEPNQNCLWQLRAPEGMVVWINITNFDVEQHVECEADVLIAGEGKGNSIIHRYCQSDANLNITFLNPLADRHRSFRTHSRYLTLSWHTNDDVELTGWKIEYEFIDEGDGCGFTTHALTGVVHSPNFPRDYPNDENCIWDIQVPIGYHVVLTFSHFDIEGATGCQNDMLQISEEHSSRSNEPLGEYYYLFEDEEKKTPMCGIITPPPVETTANRMRLNFTSNSKINAKGFRAEWTAACGAVFRLSHYQIVSPYYPQGYPNEHRECTYLIRPEGELEKAIVILKMQDFDLSPVKFVYGRFPCESDYVEIIDIMNDRVLQTFCGGEDMSEEPIAIQGPVGIKMVTNQTFMHTTMKTNRGFSVTYSMKKCGGDIEMLKDEDMVWPISSPAYPLEYPHDLECTWNFTTTEDRILMAKFARMEIEDSPLCDLDFLEMHDGSEITNLTKIGRWCGSGKNMPKGVLKTTKNSMILRFVSDSSMARGGFKLVVTATLGPKHGCGGKLEAKSEWKELRPPVKADGNYYNNLNCGWTITSPDKTMIEFKLEQMDTEELQPLPGDPIRNSCVDQLKIYDGYRSFSPLLVDNLCSDSATLLPMYFHSSHRVAHVSFETDVSGVAKGFTMVYRAVAPDCGDWLSATEAIKTVEFSSKPKRELRIGQRFQRCQWIIISNDQTPIELNFRNVNFTSPENDCTDAFIEVRDVGTISRCNHPACATHENDKKILKYCGAVPNFRFISNTMSVQITTASFTLLDEPATFTMDYQLLPGCNRTINANEIPAGRITSPNYPNAYNHNDTCLTNIETTASNKILVVFRMFRLELGRPVFYLPINQTGIRQFNRLTYRIPTCDHDFVQIYENQLLNNTKKYCGTGLPPTYLSSGNRLTLRLDTDYSVNSEGFDASYYTGSYEPVPRKWTFGPIRDPSGAVSNINYPYGYNDSQTEVFTIIPPPGQSCTFEIEVLSLAIGSGDSACITQDEYLLVEQKLDARSNFASQRVRRCSHQAPIKFNVEPADERQIRFTFVADGTTENNGVGFKAVWDCHLTSSGSDQ